MITKTNKVVYAYQLKLSKNYTTDFFQKNYNEQRIIENIYSFEDSNYAGSLLFLGEEDGGLFFKFAKIRNKNILITDLKDKKIKLSDLDKFKRYTTRSYFVYFPKNNIMLGLYNHDAMQHIAAPLINYFHGHVKDKDIVCNIIEKTVDTDKVLEKVEYINKVIIATAIRDIDIDAEEESVNPFSALKNYSEKGERIIYLPYLKGYPIKEVTKIIKDYIYKNKANSVFVSGKNINIDLLKEFMLSFPCNVKLDENGLVKFDDFKIKVIDIFNNHKDGLLKGY